MAIILQIPVSSPRLSNILGITVSVTVQFIVIYSSMSIYTMPFTVPIYYLFVPQMAFSRIYFYIAKRCMESRCYAGLHEFEGEALLSFKIFLLTAWLYPAIGLLLNYLNFAGYFSLRRLCRSSKRSTPSETEPVDLDSLHGASSDVSGEKSSLKKERDRADAITEMAKYSVVVRGVSKSYGNSSYKALKSTHLVIERGQVFGLLGPNGAGKTTLLNILTGMIKSDSGDAWIGGSSVNTELPNVYKSIGVCPQFDVFWDELTIEEHLIFYLRLKGIEPGESEMMRVDQVCSDVELLQDKRKKAKHLSGGMKRRLSLAVALIGEPDVIFLDEPTTGLDPLNREAFWKIIQNIKNRTSVILTTHLMQEADYLCDHIGSRS
jgi:ABC-type Na+ transport system ATPase subunit NatA